MRTIKLLCTEEHRYCAVYIVVGLNYFFFPLTQMLFLEIVLSVYIEQSWMFEYLMIGPLHAAELTQTPQNVQKLHRSKKAFQYYHRWNKTFQQHTWNTSRGCLFVLHYYALFWRKRINLWWTLVFWARSYCRLPDHSHVPRRFCTGRAEQNRNKDTHSTLRT